MHTEDLEHHELAWFCCIDDACDYHWEEKSFYQWYPARLGRQAMPYAYDQENDFEDYSVIHRFSNAVRMMYNPFEPAFCVQGYRSWNECEEPLCEVHKQEKKEHQKDRLYGPTSIREEFYL